MSNQMKVYCKNIEEYIDFAGGETVGEIYGQISSRLNFVPFCCKVNNKTEDLNFQLFSPKVVEFLHPSNESARRVYIHSLCMLLYHALSELYPGERLVIEHSLSRGYYCRLIGDVKPSEEMAERLKAKMKELVDRKLPFERKERLRKDVIDIFKKQQLDDKVRLLETVHDLYEVYYRLDGICDSYYGPLVPSTEYLEVFDLQVYEDGMLLLGPDPAKLSQPQQPLPQPKMFRAFQEHLQFNKIIGVDNVGELNEAVEHRRTADLINVAEALHDKKIASIADEITSRYHEGGARIVLVAGPSSSGKTTTTKRLAIYLMANLLVPKMISLDNYFVDRTRTPRDETGDYDYESLYALDLEAFNKDLNDLLEGKEVSLPTYNFETGTRMYKGDKIKLGDNTVLLIEGIHGLNPQLTASIEEKMKYRVYVSALTTLSIDDHNWIPTTDNRLLRRIIRDYKYRGTSAIETIRRWPSVRRGEEKWIFPFQENADSTFNSSLIFELGVIKDYAMNVLRDVPHDAPEYSEAYRLMKFLSFFTSIGERLIPPTSLLREFLGGSSFHY
ncbi:MAG: nucleoside kinase [Muribaculaceae bacterium]|nr:nucleoside kinase [Muribaculaceae bacterium]MDE6643158.1 nucleoside kinase [Muribaculaceae bacterium]